MLIRGTCLAYIFIRIVCPIQTVPFLMYIQALAVRPLRNKANASTINITYYFYRQWHVCSYIAVILYWLTHRTRLPYCSN